jgi:hypothetical protein
MTRPTNDRFCQGAESHSVVRGRQIYLYYGIRSATEWPLSVRTSGWSNIWIQTSTCGTLLHRTVRHNPPPSTPAPDIYRQRFVMVILRDEQRIDSQILIQPTQLGSDILITEMILRSQCSTDGTDSDSDSSPHPCRPCRPSLGLPCVHLKKMGHFPFIHHEREHQRKCILKMRTYK